jgi:hypothetical protein
MTHTYMQRTAGTLISDPSSGLSGNREKIRSRSCSMDAPAPNSGMYCFFQFETLNSPSLRCYALNTPRLLTNQRTINHLDCPLFVCGVCECVCVCNCPSRKAGSWVPGFSVFGFYVLYQKISVCVCGVGSRLVFVWVCVWCGQQTKLPSSVRARIKSL